MPIKGRGAIMGRGRGRGLIYISHWQCSCSKEDLTVAPYCNIFNNNFCVSSLLGDSQQKNMNIWLISAMQNKVWRSLAAPQWPINDQEFRSLRTYPGRVWCLCSLSCHHVIINLIYLRSHPLITDHRSLFTTIISFCNNFQRKKSSTLSPAPENLVLKRPKGWTQDVYLKLYMLDWSVFLAIEELFQRHLE